MHREGELWTGSCDQCGRSPGDRGQSGTTLYLGNVWVRVFLSFDCAFQLPCLLYMTQISNDDSNFR